MLAVSVFNFGEVASALDKKSRCGELLGDVKTVISLITRGKTLTRLGNFVVALLVGGVLKDAISISLNHHIYIVDALQVATCRYVRCTSFYTAAVCRVKEFIHHLRCLLLYVAFNKGACV